MPFSRIQIVTIRTQETLSDSALFRVELPTKLLQTLVVDLSHITTLYFEHIYRNIHTT